ncbi:MAG: PAS domain S-box protein [Planctomycetes bacterium]|nr:PAS domain S-box protein [Planctomycetota bacterium]
MSAHPTRPQVPELDQRALRDLFDGVSDFVQSVLPDGSIRFVNRPWLERLGYTFEEVAGRNIFEIVHPESREHCMHYMQRLIGGEDVGLMEVIFETKSGEPVHLEGKVNVQFENGVPLVTRGVFREQIPDMRGSPSLVRLREQRKLFHSVLSILRANSAADRGEFLALVTQQVATALGVARASVWLFDESHARITCEQLWSDGRSLGRTATDLFRTDHRAYFEALEALVPVRADDAIVHPATRSFADGYLRPLGIASMIDMPLHIGATVAGVLCCEHIGKARRWTKDEEEFGLAVAAILLIFLENDRRVRAEAELQRLNAELELRVEERARKLASAEERLRYLMTAVPAVIFSCEPAGDFRSTFVSPNIETQLGYPASEYLAYPHFWREHLHPDDAARAYLILGRVATQGSASFEYRFRFPNGEYRWLRDDYMLMRDAEDNPIEIVGACVDIHDRRMAEAAAEALARDLRHLIESANAPILGEDMHGRINEWNAATERLTGFSRAEVLGRSFVELVPPGQRRAMRDVFDAARHGIESANVEVPVVSKDGRALLFLLSTSTRRDRDGQVIGVVGLGQDITEHREAQRRSLRAQRLESIGTLAGGVAHDINNALAPILLACGLIRDRHPESRDLIDVMESSARRGASMVQQLLTFAKGVDGKRVPLRPQFVVAEIERIVRSTFPKNIRASFEVDPGLPPILGDATQLHQVLLNLCVNARDAMANDGELRVSVLRRMLTAAEVRQDGDGVPGEYLQFRVEDSGHGIPPELAERIFEPFFSTKSVDLGTGLGLSTAVGIVRSHGGFMRVQSELGKGSAFTVLLPAHHEPEHAAEVPVPRTSEGFRGAGELILVVDDEPAVRDVFRQILTALGLRVRTAQDGRGALEILDDASNPIAGVITDLHMPVMDGIELAREIRRRRPDLPIVLASGYAEKADPQTFSQLRFTAQIYKPFSLETLSHALRRMLRPA